VIKTTYQKNWKVFNKKGPRFKYNYRLLFNNFQKGDIMGNYVILDIETTGLSKHRHRITEIAAIKIKGEDIVGEFQSLVDPEVPIPKFITSLTGITNEMVKDAKTIDKVLPSLIDFIGSDILVAHSATFDHGFLKYNAEKIGIRFFNEKLCTRKLANRLLQNLPSKKLGCVCEHLEIVNEQAHRAMADTKATMKIFLKFKRMMYELDIKTPEDIKMFEKATINKNYEKFKY
jgi:DNA polymerase-3 subunit alpha (Gram-positive type)